MSRVKIREEKVKINYPESDGKPMADNTLQYQWIVTIKENLDELLPDFVAGDLLWYPVERDNKTRVAPDVMVAIGRPKGHRGSYQQWLENDIAPQVVFEILSPGNTKKEMSRKLDFYQEYRVFEYYVYNPDKETLLGYIRQGDTLIRIAQMSGWTSPLLNIRFELSSSGLTIFYPTGEPFLSWQEAASLRRQARTLAEQERLRAQEANHRAEQEHLRAEEEHLRAEEECLRAEEANEKIKLLLEKLRAKGIDPESL